MLREKLTAKIAEVTDSKIRNLTGLGLGGAMGLALGRRFGDPIGAGLVGAMLGGGAAKFGPDLLKQIQAAKADNSPVFAA